MITDQDDLKFLKIAHNDLAALVGSSGRVHCLETTKAIWYRIKNGTQDGLIFYNKNHPDLYSNMRVFITAATVGEWMPAFLEVDKLYTTESVRFKVGFHQAGVGLLSTAVSLTRLVFEEKPDLIVQVGIAGCFDTTIPLGKVVVISDEMLGDMGVWEDSKWKDIFDLKLERGGYPPYEKRKLPNRFLDRYNLLKLPEVPAITVNEITTDKDRILQLIKKYDPTVESMEGAALHYVCREMNIPFIQIRAISNYIGERDKEQWKMKEAIENLTQVILKYIERSYHLS